nr:hypothetical protein [Tanacetum cinerariifolium]
MVVLGGVTVVGTKGESGGCGRVVGGDSGGGLWCRQRGDDGSHGGAAMVVTGRWCRGRRRVRRV